MLNNLTNIVTLRDQFAVACIANNTAEEAYAIADLAIKQRETHLKQLTSYNVQKLIGEISYLAITNQNEKLTINVETSTNKFYVEIKNDDKLLSQFGVAFTDESALNSLTEILTVVRQIVIAK